MLKGLCLLLYILGALFMGVFAYPEFDTSKIGERIVFGMVMITWPVIVVGGLGLLACELIREKWGIK